MVSRISVENVLKESESFFDKYHTFNQYAVSKHNPKLNKHINSIFPNYKQVISKSPILKDFGSRIWTHNNICLEYPHGKIPKEVVSLIEKKKGGKISLHEEVGKTFVLPGNLEDQIETVEDLFKFIQTFLNCELEIKETKEGAIYAEEMSPKFGISIIPLKDEYYHQELHKSIYSYDKYCRGLRSLIKRTSQPVVIEMCDDILVRDIMYALLIGGVNFYGNFNFLAIDPPTTSNLGFCVMNYQNGEFKTVESDTFELPGYLHREKTIKSIYEFVERIVSDYWCKAIVSESSFGFGIQKVRTLLSENVGIFRLIAEQYSVPFLTISPKHFKLNVLGDAAADKEKTIKWASKYSDKKIGEIQEHEADAICIAISYLIDRELINVPK